MDHASCGTETSETALEFAHWLVAALNNIIVRLKKEASLMNWTVEEVNVLTNSDDFTKKWQDFLKLISWMTSLFFYKHFTDELFDIMLQNKLRTVLDAEGTSTTVEVDENGSVNANWSFEEENMVCYTGGYLVKKQQGHSGCSEFKQLLNDMVSSDVLDKNSVAESGRML